MGFERWNTTTRTAVETIDKRDITRAVNRSRTWILPHLFMTDAGQSISCSLRWKHPTKSWTYRPRVRSTRPKIIYAIVFVRARAFHGYSRHVPIYVLYARTRVPVYGVSVCVGSRSCRRRETTQNDWRFIYCRAACVRATEKMQRRGPRTIIIYIANASETLIIFRTRRDVVRFKNTQVNDIFTGNNMSRTHCEQNTERVHTGTLWRVRCAYEE